MDVKRPRAEWASTIDGTPVDVSDIQPQKDKAYKPAKMPSFKSKFGDITLKKITPKKTIKLKGKTFNQESA